jgi:SH3-like domain-containing protein
MRPLLGVLVWCCLLTASAAGGEPVFPYTAYVTGDDVYVRSGPGQSYYPTDKLKAGQEVEIYRHDPGGWYAIRPPDGSFSWIAGRFLQPGVENLAVVNADRVAARVGSRFSDIRDVIQVRLHQAEVVEVLEKKQSRSGSDGETWYKIAPPSGEFRWVFGKYVDTEYPRDGLRKTSEGEAGVTPAAHEGGTSQKAEGRIQNAADGDLAQSSIINHQSSIIDHQSARGTGVTPVAVPVGPREMSPEQFQAELERIDLELSVMVIEEPTVWAFDEMQRGAELLLAQAETALERGRARLLANKVSRFQDIKRRHDAIAAMREETERTNRQLAGLHPRGLASGTGVTPVARAEGRFDGEGELIRVVSPRTDAPRYALVDELGEVRCYVSPAPGVNLRHYLGREVGVTGTRGYMPEQHARHVMARRVSLLEDRRLR